MSGGRPHWLLCVAIPSPIIKSQHRSGFPYRFPFQFLLHLSHHPLLPFRRRRRYRLSLPIYVLSDSHPPNNASRKCVVCSLQVSTTKRWPVSLIVTYSLFHAFWFLSTWFEFCGVSGEGHLYYTLYLHHVHIRVEGHH